jgi:hypothetical protein
MEEEQKMDVNGVSSHSGVLGATGRTRPQIAAQPSQIEQAKKPTISDAAHLFSKLHKLQQDDPGKFRDVTAKIADRLRGKASVHSGPESSMLNDIAQLFSQASKSADVSSLTPPPSAKGAIPGLSISSVPQVPREDIGQLIKSTLEDEGV